MKTVKKGKQSALTPELALEWLKKGNQRYAINLKFKRKILVQANQFNKNQRHFAYVLSCTDSHPSPDLIFDQGTGGIFNAHSAGNSINNNILASMEFACKVAGSKLIVVLGHTKCMAVRHTCDHVEIDNLTALLVKFQPSFYNNFVDKVAAINVKRAVQTIQIKSPLLKDMIQTGKIGIIGGCYDVASGNVTFFDDTLVIKQPKKYKRQSKRITSKLSIDEQIA